MNYGLRIDNLTNFDKSKNGTITQPGSFTVVGGTTDTQALYIGDDVENVTIKDCTFISVQVRWRYRLLKWAATWLSK